MNADAFDRKAAEILAARITDLEHLSYAQAGALPKASGTKIRIGDRECQVTTFTQHLHAGDVLVTVQIAQPALAGLITHHSERGLLFCADGTVREATTDELQKNGG